MGRKGNLGRTCKGMGLEVKGKKEKGGKCGRSG